MNKIDSPKELPTFRPEIATKYYFGRREKKDEDEQEQFPHKIFIEDMGISRNHLLIVFDASGWNVMDLGSSGGSVINRQQKRVLDNSIDNDDDDLQPAILSNKLERGTQVVLEEGDWIVLSEGIAELRIISCKFSIEDYYVIVNMNNQ
jgi:pSer/pThr/pTyr-binding forkhead associated (FHA) protein